MAALYDIIKELRNNYLITESPSARRMHLVADGSLCPTVSTSPDTTPQRALNLDHCCSHFETPSAHAQFVPEILR